MTEQHRFKVATYRRDRPDMTVQADVHGPGLIGGGTGRPRALECEQAAERIARRYAALSLGVPPESLRMQYRVFGDDPADCIVRVGIAASPLEFVFHYSQKAAS